MSGNPIINIRDLSFSYNDTTVLENVDLTLDDRELTCFVGPNGGGKTTLIRIIMGLLKPDSGTVRVFGQPPKQVRDRIGYLPQYTRHDLQFPITVMEVVLMGRLERNWFGSYSREDREAAHQALEEMDMADYADAPFSELSGGQTQRVLIARALSTTPDLLVLDEPTSNVDVVAENQLFDILHELSERLAIIMVSHDLVSDMIEKVVCVNRTVHIHPTGEISNEALAELYEGTRRMVHHDRHVGRGHETDD